MTHLQQSLYEEQHCEHAVQHLKSLLECSRGRQAGHVQRQGHAACKDEQQDAMLKVRVAQQLVQPQPEPMFGAKQAASTTSKWLAYSRAWRLLLRFMAGGVWRKLPGVGTLQQQQRSSRLGCCNPYSPTLYGISCCVAKSTTGSEDKNQSTRVAGQWH